MRLTITLVLLMFSLISCTESQKQTMKGITSIVPGIIDNEDTPIDSKQNPVVDVESEIQKIKKELNDDQEYIIKQEDVDLLVSEGVIQGQELKGWVK